MRLLELTVFFTVPDASLPCCPIIRQHPSRFECHKSCKICLGILMTASLLLGRNAEPEEMFFQLDATSTLSSPTGNLLPR